MSGSSAGCGGDVGGAVTAVDADGEVAQYGHDRGAVAGADLAVVFGEGDVADPVQPVLDVPVAADDVGDLVGSDLALVQVGDRVDGLGAPPFAVERSATTCHLDGEAGVREADADTHCGGLHGARFGPSVPLAAGHVDGRDLTPGQRLELRVQLGLVALDDEQVVSIAPGQVVGVLALGVQSVRGDDRVGEVDAVQQRRECRYLIGLPVHDTLPEHDPVAMFEGGEQVHQARIGPTRAAHALAVDRDRPPTTVSYTH